jgi:hypothetical protein
MRWLLCDKYAKVYTYNALTTPTSESVRRQSAALPERSTQIQADGPLIMSRKTAL